jgi:hypothetical protein
VGNAEKSGGTSGLFMRHLKLGPNGGKRKKPYYLNDMMQFVILFLKPATSDVLVMSQSHRVCG